MENKHYVNWTEMEFLVNQLVYSMEDTNWRPDTIMAVSRGGLVPGVMLSHKMNLPLIPLRWSTRDYLYRDEETIDDIIEELLNEHKVLIIDDICDTGATFAQIEEYFIDSDAHRLVEEKSRLRYASLHLRYNSEFLPNYHARLLNDDNWVVYPYEADL